LLLQDPAECLPPFEEALEELVRNHHPKTLESSQVHIAFGGELGPNRVSPRQLLSNLVGQLVAVEGIVTKASLVRPKWVKSVHFCKKTQRTIVR
jgi:DNA replication licensing factor MCM3